jgi:ethanolaminephosphotransferase
VTSALLFQLEVVIGAYALNLGRGWWTIGSMVAALTNFYLTTWEEYNTGKSQFEQDGYSVSRLTRACFLSLGTLYLSEFSGPVEGILLICGVYFITGQSHMPPFLELWYAQFRLTWIIVDRSLLAGVYGPSFWDQKVLHLVGIDRFPLLAKYIPDLGLNDSFMVFGAFSLAANIINSYGNVIIARRKANKPILPPLFGLIPFCANTFFLLAWLHAEPTSNVLKSKRLLPFLGYWGFGFAYQVGTLILAHVAKMPFPVFNGLMLWSAVGALDANAQRIFGV